MSAPTLPPVTDPFADNNEEPLIELSDAIDDEPTVELDPPPMPERSGAKLTREQQQERTPEFPYGRKADGSPRNKPGPPPNPNSKRQNPPRVGAAKPRKTTPRKQTTGTDYRPGITGLLQIPAAALGAMGMKDRAFALDGAALAIHTPGIAEALNDLAQDNLAVAAALDRILAVGPYGAILGALLPLAAQIAANHRALPDQILTGMGAMPAEQFEQYVIAQSGMTGA